MPKTCTLCRERSVHCDGMQPTCGQCTDFGAAIACDYSSRAAGPCSRTSNLLQKGAACLPCRKRKKKCDAKRPCCTTCNASNRQAYCLYEDDAQRNLIQSLVARTRQLEERLASAEQSPRNSPPLSNYSPPPSTSVPVQPPLSDVFGAFPPWKPPVTDRPVFSTRISSRISLEQYRDFRLQFLAFSAHVGVKLSPAASNAVAIGDFYSPHVHPSLIHAAQLLGCRIWQEINRTTLTNVDSFELEATLSLLTTDTAPLVQIQIHNVLGIYFFIRRMIPEGCEQIRLASEIARRHGLRFVTPSADLWDPLLEPSPEDEEKVCALSQLLYINLDRHMVLGIPSSLGVEYEQDFQSIPMMYPMLSRSYLSILRARGMLLLQRTQQLSARLDDLPSCPWEPHLSQGGRAEPPGWITEYWSLLEEVETNLASVNPALLKASLQPDLQRSTHGLKLCLIVALTAEAELHHLAPRSHPESRQHCLNAVLKLVGIGKTLTANDYEMLDPILGICWLKAAKVTFTQSMRPMDELSAMNWATARSVLVACVPVLVKSLPYLEVSLNRILDRAASFVIPAYAGRPVSPPYPT